MIREQAINRASEIAYEEDRDQIVGYDLYHGWRICDSEDEGCKSNLREMVKVNSEGETDV